MNQENLESISQEGHKASQAARIKNLFTKHKEWFSRTYKTAPFEEPVLFFERRSGDVEFYEKATQGIFTYTHSDGSIRFVVLVPKFKKKFGFANKSFTGYYCHEDHPLPFPQDPYMTAEQMNILVEKSLNDIQKLKAQEISAKSDFFWKICLGIALIIGVIFIGYTIMPHHPDPVIQVVAPLAAHVAPAINTSGAVLIP